MKKHLTAFAKLPVQTKVEYVAQALLYLFVAPRAYNFFYGDMAAVGFSWQRLVVGLAFILMFAGTYALAVAIMKNTTSRERWALFFLSFVLVPLPLAIAHRFSQKLTNVWASMGGAVAAYLVAQIAVSYLFRVYMSVIDRIVA